MDILPGKKYLIGILVSYDEKENSQININPQLQILQTNLDMGRARDLKLLGRALIINSLSPSELIYSPSNLNVPHDQKSWSLLRSRQRWYTYDRRRNYN